MSCRFVSLSWSCERKCLGTTPYWNKQSYDWTKQTNKQLPWVTLQADHRSIGSSMVLEVWSATCQSMLLHVYTCHKSYTCDCDVTCGLRGSCWSRCRLRWSWGWAACGYCCGSRPTKMTNVNISIIIETSYMFNILIIYMYIVYNNCQLVVGQRTAYADQAKTTIAPSLVGGTGLTWNWSLWGNPSKEYKMKYFEYFYISFTSNWLKHYW